MGQDYHNYEVEDFLAEESFQQHCSGVNEEATRYWEEVLLEQPEMNGRFSEAEKMFRLLNGNQGNVQEEVAKVMRRIEASGEEPAKVRRIFPVWAAAAAVLLIVLSGIWFIVKQEKVVEPIVADVQSEILPGGNKAVLTLADGRKVVLDSTNAGTVIDENGVQVIQLNGELSYDAGTAAAEVQYNTITTPRGGQYKVILADGSRVWLNAESSLRYPTAFTGKERKVEMNGEGYFEVAKNASKPFVVEVGDMKVEVLGTEFNVNAYEDEEAIRTTLLEGSVKVSAGGQKDELIPGEQANLNSDSKKLEKIEIDDVGQVVAWKNGYFSFENANLKDVMRQIARWYDVEVKYEGTVQHRNFGGGVSRKSKLNEVLKILEESNVRFTMEGKTITVKP